MIDTRVSVEEAAEEIRNATGDREWQRRLERTKRTLHEIGGHVKPDPDCPVCVAVTA